MPISALTAQVQPFLRRVLGVLDLDVLREPLLRFAGATYNRALSVTPVVRPHPDCRRLHVYYVRV